jgi:hypothetical protein
MVLDVLPPSALKQLSDLRAVLVTVPQGRKAIIDTGLLGHRFPQPSQPHFDYLSALERERAFTEELSTLDYSNVEFPKSVADEYEHLTTELRHDLNEERPHWESGNSSLIRAIEDYILERSAFSTNVIDESLSEEPEDAFRKYVRIVQKAGNEYDRYRRDTVKDKVFSGHGLERDVYTYALALLRSPASIIISQDRKFESFTRFVRRDNPELRNRLPVFCYLDINN